MEASDNVKSVTIVTPATESQARPLAGLEPEQQKAIRRNETVANLPPSEKARDKAAEIMNVSGRASSKFSGGTDSTTSKPASQSQAAEIVLCVLMCFQKGDRIGITHD